MSRKKIKHQPKLYISQPITQFPDIIMQSRYSTRISVPSKQAEEQKDVHEQEPQESLEIIEVNHSQEEADVQSSEKPSPSSNPFDTKRRKQYSFQRVRNFKEMTLDEKILYLENFPEQLTPVSCLFITASTTYTGILHQSLGTEIEILLPDQSLTSIRKTELLEIRMLGFH